MDDSITFQLFLFELLGLLFTVLVFGFYFYKKWAKFRESRWLRKRAREKEKLLRRLRKECRHVERARKLAGETHITGYKHAMIGWRDGELFFRPMRNRSVYYYLTKDQAICMTRYDELKFDDRDEANVALWEEYLKDPYAYVRRGVPHDANPNSTHHCGFYAVMRDDHLGIVPLSKPYAFNLQFAVKLMVDLSGRVLVHEYCYRAAKQEVLRVSVPRRCQFTDKPIGSAVSHMDLCPGRATHMACLQTTPVRINGGPIKGLLEPALMPVCMEHTMYARSQSLPVYSLATVADALQTEVLWDDEQPSTH